MKRLVFVIFIAILIRILYFSMDTQLRVEADTWGYYDVGKRILTGETIIDPIRPPLYPIFLHVRSMYMRRVVTPILSPLFWQDMEKIVLIQSTLGITTTIVVFVLTLQLTKSVRAATVMGILSGTNIMVFGMERILLTESLVTFLLSCFTLFAVMVVQRGSCKWIVLFSLFALGLFFTKPIYSLLPIGVIPIVFLKRRTMQTIAQAATICLFFLAVVVGYMSANATLNNYKGISRVSDYNQLGKILTYNLDISAAADEPSFYPKMIEYRKLGKELMPFRFMEWVDPLYWTKPELLNEMNRFTSRVTMANLPEYVCKSVIQLPSAQLSPNESILLHSPAAKLLDHVFIILYEINSINQYATLILIPGFIVACYGFLRRHQKSTDAPWVLVGAIGVYQVVFSTFFSYGEFGRLISPALPIVYLFSFYCWIHAGKWSKNILKSTITNKIS